MPDYLTICAVEPSFEQLHETIRASIDASVYPEVDDDLHTYTTLAESLKKLADAQPTLLVDVLYRESSSWVSVSILRLRAGRVETEAVELSLDPNDFVDPDAEPAPDVEIELDLEADALVDSIGAATDDPDEVEADGEMLCLPMDYKGADSAADALALVAGHLADESHEIVIEAPQGQFYRAVIDRAEGVRMDPLHLWTKDTRLRQWVSRLFAPPTKSVSRAPRAHSSPASSVDKTRPLATGSARSRMDAAYALARPTKTIELDGLTITRAADGPAPNASTELRAALVAPENAGASYSKLRQELYELLRVVDGNGSVDALLAGLDGESEDVRRTIYRELSWIDDARAARALISGLKRDRELHYDIRQLLARAAAVTELLVKEELVPNWDSDRKWAQEIVEVIKEEYLRVPAEWLRPAPPELAAALGSLVE